MFKKINMIMSENATGWTATAKHASGTSTYTVTGTGTITP